VVRVVVELLLQVVVELLATCAVVAVFPTPQFVIMKFMLRHVVVDVCVPSPCLCGEIL
jgi:hypothetical protein